MTFSDICDDNQDYSHEASFNQCSALLTEMLFLISYKKY